MHDVEGVEAGPDAPGLRLDLLLNEVGAGGGDYGAGLEGHELAHGSEIAR